MNRTIKCEKCDGSGFNPSPIGHPCSVCEGTGELYKEMSNEELKDYLIDCVLNDDYSDEIIKQIEHVFEMAERYEDLNK